MSVALSTLINRLKVSLDEPGVESYGTVSDTEWELRLENAFWMAYNDGFLQGFTIDDGSDMATPVTNIAPQTVGGDDITADLQQLVIMYAAIDSIRSRLFGLQTLFRAKAGPVEYEVQQSASVMKTLLDQFSEQRRHLLEKLEKSLQASSTTFAVDAFLARQEAINYEYVQWVDA